MAKIGTAHVEIKPVIDEEALSAIADRIADAVAEGVRRGMASAKPSTTVINCASPQDYIDEMRRRADG